jgi:uncharacterized tellurite resistance protein B-like protein
MENVMNEMDDTDAFDDEVAPEAHSPEPQDLVRDKFGNHVDQNTMASVVGLLCLMDQMEPSIEHREFQEIIQLLAREFQLADEQAAHLTEMVNFLLKDKLNVQGFVGRLNKDFSALQRSRILNLVWDVAMADGIVTEKEKQLYGFLREELRLDMLGRSVDGEVVEEADDENE